MPVIQVNNLKKHFGETKAIDDISFDVNEGEIVGFLGPNGAGKTTTIRCLLDFIRPDDGTISIFEHESESPTPQLKHRIGFLPAEVNLYEGWTGEQHIRYVAKMQQVQTTADELIQRLQFFPHLKKKVKTLSSGNKQKLGLILALLHHPELIILDEPTNGLDPILQNTIYELLNEQVENKRTIFFSSHNLTEVERVCDRVIIIKQGKLVATETIQDLRDLRLYTITVMFNETVGQEIIHKIDNVEITQTFDTGYQLKAKGDINPTLEVLHTYAIKDLEIRHATLEEIFLEYYK